MCIHKSRPNGHHPAQDGGEETGNAKPVFGPPIMGTALNFRKWADVDDGDDECESTLADFGLDIKAEEHRADTPSTGDNAVVFSIKAVFYICKANSFTKNKIPPPRWVKRRIDY